MIRKKFGIFMLFIGSAVMLYASESRLDFSPKPTEQQLPKAMRSTMTDLPKITVGQSNADIIGKDNRALQAAVDAAAGLGGGLVEIGEGVYEMHDSLHLRSHVTVRGKREKTILRKANGVSSPLAIDGDYGEEQITVTNPAGFEVGYGVAVWDANAGGFYATVARITGRNGNICSIDKPLNADCMVGNKALAATVFPVVSGCFIEDARVEDLTVDGNKDNNIQLNGCRGAGIYLYRAFGTVIQGCVARNYNGDGIGFQQSNDAVVVDCLSEGNTVLGFHPGSGSQRPAIRNCVARRNGSDGLFLCWRVRNGIFESNLLEENGQYGISIGHKDSDNFFRRNTVRLNRQDGVFFRNEALGMAAHRNRLEDNLIENNGVAGPAAGIRVRGETNGLIFRHNTIRDTRAENFQTQTVGICLEEKVGAVIVEDNTVSAKTQMEDQRKTKSE